MSPARHLCLAMYLSQLENENKGPQHNSEPQSQRLSALAAERQFASPPSADPTVPGRGSPGEGSALTPTPCPAVGQPRIWLALTLDLAVPSALAAVPSAMVQMAPHRHSPCIGSCPCPSSPFAPQGSFLPLRGYMQLQHRTLTGATGEKCLGRVYWEVYVTFVIRNSQLSDETSHFFLALSLCFTLCAHRAGLSRPMCQR